MVPLSMDRTEARELASAWLAIFASALQSGDPARVLACIMPDGWFRDSLVFSWENRTLHGSDEVSEYLTPALGSRRIYNLQLCDQLSLAPVYGPLSPWSEGISAGFTFETPIANGLGYFRTQKSSAEGKANWKAFTVFMQMRELKGHEEIGPEEGVYSGHTLAWSDVLRERKKIVEHDPYVVVLGGGQTGLTLGARFKQMGLSTIIIEKNARVGDNWRKRYPTLTLHTPKAQHPMLYQPFPQNWPRYTPRDKLADWLESYAISQDLVVWTNSTILPTPKYDSTSKRWTIIVDHNGQQVTLKPAHIVIATGAIGSPNVPAFPGAESFHGRILHTSVFRGGQEFTGKRVVVVGSGNSSADVCQDLCHHGAQSVTMVQRNSTCVMKASSIGAAIDQSYPPDESTDISDFKFASTPLFLIKNILSASAEFLAKVEEDIHQGLRQAGFSVNMGDDGSGVFPMVFERHGGYWLDVGCADLIAKGQVKIKQGVTVSEITPDGIKFNDNTVIKADDIILATGYENIHESNETLFGKETISSTIRPFGVDKEGELNGAYRPSGHLGLWYATGDFYVSRFFSKQLALILKAVQLDLLDS